MPSSEFRLNYTVAETGADTVKSKFQDLNRQGQTNKEMWAQMGAAAEAMASAIGRSSDTIISARSKEADASERAQRRILTAWDSATREDQRRTQAAKSEADKRIADMQREADEEQKAANKVFQMRQQQWKMQQDQQKKQESDQSRGFLQLGRGAGSMLGGSGSGPLSSIGGALGLSGGALGIGLAGAGALAGLAKMTTDATQAAQQIQNLSNEFGISASRIFQFQSAARLTGQDLGTMSQAARRLSIAIEEPGGEGKKTAEALTAMGVSLSGGLGPALDDFLKKLGDTKNQTTALHDAVEVFGRDGAKFVQFAQALKGFGDTGIDNNLIKTLNDAQVKLEQLDIKWTIFKSHLAEKIVVSLDATGKAWDWLNQNATISNKTLAEKMSAEQMAKLPPPSPHAPRALDEGIQLGDAARLRRVLNDPNNKESLQEQISAKQQELRNIEALARNDAATGHTQGQYDKDAQSINKARAELKALQDREKSLGKAPHIDPYGDAKASYLESSQNRNLGAIGSAMDARDDFIRRYSVARGDNPAHPDAYRTAQQGYNERLGFGANGSLTYGQGAIGEIAKRAAKDAMDEARKNAESDPLSATWANAQSRISGLAPLTSTTGKELGDNWANPESKLFSENLRRTIAEQEQSRPEETYKRLIQNDSRFSISAMQRQYGLQDSLRKSGGNDSADAQMRSSIELAQKEYELRMQAADQMLKGEEKITEQIQAQGDLAQQIDEARIKRQEELAAQAQQQQKETGQFFSGWVMASLSGQPGAASNFLKDFGKQQFSKVVSNVAENTVGSMNKWVGLGNTGILGTQENPSFLGKVFEGTPLDFDAKSEMAKNPLQTATDANTTATAANTAAIVQMLNAAGIDTSGIPKTGLPGTGGPGASIAGSMTGMAGNATEIAKAAMSGNPQAILQSVMGAGRSVAGMGGSGSGSRGGFGGLLGSIGLGGGTAPFIGGGVMGGDGSMAIPFSPGIYSGVSLPNLGGFGGGSGSPVSNSDLDAANTSISSSIGKAFSDNISRYPSITPTGQTDDGTTDVNAASGISKTLGNLFGGAKYGVNGYGAQAVFTGQGTNADGSMTDLSDTQRLGAALGMGGQMAGGIMGAVKGFSQGGARGDIGGIAGAAAALAPLTGPLAPFLDAGAGILGMVESLFPDPREERIKQENRGILNQAYIKPAAHDYSFNSSGGQGQTYSEGGGMQASGPGSTTNNHFWINSGMTAQELFEEQKKDPQGLADMLTTGISSSSASQYSSLAAYVAQYGGT